MNATIQLFELKIQGALAASDLEALEVFMNTYKAYVDTHVDAITNGLLNMDSATLNEDAQD